MCSGRKFVGVTSSLLAVSANNLNLRKLVLLNSDSNITMFCNEKFIRYEIWKVAESMVADINGGLVRIN